MSQPGAASVSDERRDEDARVHDGTNHAAR